MTNEFIQQHNRRPSIHELSELTGIDESRIRQSQNADNHHMSIDAPFSDDDDNSMANRNKSDGLNTVIFPIQLFFPNQF